MKIAIPRERWPGELRVAATPDTVKRLVGMGCTVAVEKGAGAGAAIPDAAFKEAGATIAGDAGSATGSADIVLVVRAPKGAQDIGTLKKGAVLIGLMDPHRNGPVIEALAKKGVTVFGMELLPRITRAQNMDVLSSQANLAGYRAVIDAAAHFGRAFPMMMTAAGTIAPAKVFVMGAGVAGLQAIATARRLGAVVSATDVRMAAKEQVESLGAKFVTFEGAEDLETEAGYAREMTKEEQQKQAEAVARHLTSQDVVVTTALIPGRDAPRLISRQMVATMKPGAVIVDLAVEAGGNVEGSKPDETVKAGEVTILGYSNVPSRIAVDASQLYARNLLNFLTPLIDQEKGALAIDWEDQIVTDTALTRDGKVIHSAVGTAKGSGAGKAAPATKATAAKSSARAKKAAGRKKTSAGTPSGSRKKS